MGMDWIQAGGPETDWWAEVRPDSRFAAACEGKTAAQIEMLVHDLVATARDQGLAPEAIYSNAVKQGAPPSLVVYTLEIQSMAEGTGEGELEAVERLEAKRRRREAIRESREARHRRQGGASESEATNTFNGVALYSLLIVVLAFFAWNVWPTPWSHRDGYIVQKDELGLERRTPTTIRKHFFTDDVEYKDPESGAWLPWDGLVLPGG